MVWDPVSFQAYFVAINEVHEVDVEVNIIVDFVTVASSMVAAFEAMGRPAVGMVKCYLISSMVLSPLEFLHSFLRHTLSLFMSIRKSSN